MVCRAGPVPTGPALTSPAVWPWARHLEAVLRPRVVAVNRSWLLHRVWSPDTFSVLLPAFGLTDVWSSESRLCSSLQPQALRPHPRLGSRRATLFEAVTFGNVKAQRLTLFRKRTEDAQGAAWSPGHLCSMSFYPLGLPHPCAHLLLHPLGSSILHLAQRAGQPSNPMNPSNPLSASLQPIRSASLAHFNHSQEKAALALVGCSMDWMFILV